VVLRVLLELVQWAQQVLPVVLVDLLVLLELLVLVDLLDLLELLVLVELLDLLEILELV
jgi:hypothetical protein